MAYTIDHVNCLVDIGTERDNPSSIVFTGDAEGPKVAYKDGDEKTEHDILMDYVENLFTQRAGYERLVHPLSYWYHDKGGDIHCGTNVRRTAPTEYNWWDN